MTPSSSASSRNRRSATLANIPPPSGPPPPTPPEGHPSASFGHRHSNSSSALSSFSSGPLNLSGLGSHPGGSSFAPPRASFSSSRASPVGQLRSGRERSDTETWSDSAWRNIFDAALVKAQQAVQLDELQETALAANLYAQAANDLGRVIPMCSSEKKQQSMMAIQAIYLDRVAQLKESALSKSPLPPSLGAGSFGSGHVEDGSSSSSNSYRHSVPSNRGTAYGDEQLPYQPQQYQPPSFQSPVQQQRYSQSGPIQLQQQYQPPPVFLQSRQDPYQQQQIQQQHQHRLLYLQQQQQQQQQQLQQQEEPQQEQLEKGGFRLFGKKRSKTQPSAPYPPALGQSAHGGLDHNSSYNNGFSPYGEYNGNSAPHDSPSPPLVVVSPIFMSQSPAQRSQQSRNSLMGDGREQQQPQELTSKSSKWRPFGKKKSKSFSNNETSTAFNPQRDSLQVVPAESLPSPLPAVAPTSAPPLADHSFSHQNQDWYVKSVPQEELEADYDDFENQYYDDDDEDVDPYYIADTKGRAQVFEGRDSRLKDKASKKSVKKEEEAPPKSRQTLKHSASSYSQERYYSANVNFSEHSPSTLVIHDDTQELHSGPLADEKAYTSNFTDDNPDDVVHEHDQQLFSPHADQYSEYEEQFMDAQESFTADAQDSALPDTCDVNNNEEEEAAVHGTMATDSAFDPTSESNAEGAAVVAEEQQVETGLEKTKSKRTWFGKKKKDKEKNKDKTKEPERFDDVAKLMDEALFGGGGGGSSSRKKTKQKLKEKESVISLAAAAMPEMPQQQEDADALTLPQIHPEPQVEVSVDDQGHVQPVDSAETGAEMQSPVEMPPSLDEEVTPEQQVVNDGMVEATEISEVPEVPEVTVEAGATATEAEETTEGSVHGGSGRVSVATQETTSIASDTPKRSMTRHFSIFKSKKNKDADQLQHQEDEGTPLTRTTTVEDEKKSIHSHLTQQSSHSAQDRKAAEMAAALAVRPKEKQAKKRDSDEYVPYEYQEELEGPLMERVEVPEHREIIGFVMPIEEIGDYTMEENEEAALENWDSWVSQLESFEKVLSDKGMKKEKTKKPKKVKEPKPSKEESHSPMGSVKANRSSIFSLGRSETLKSRTSTTLDLNAHLLDSRPLSMSTTFLDDPSTSSSRLSFQSSKSGESEAPTMQALALHHNQQQQQPAKKRWWNPKRKDTNSLYRVSNAFSMADLDDHQDRHLLALRQSDQIRSSDSLMLDTQVKPLASNLLEPSTPAPGMNSVNKEPLEPARASVEKEQSADQEEVEAKVEAEAGSNVKPETDIDAETEFKPKADVGAETEAEVEAKSEIAAKVEAKSEIAAKVNVDVPVVVTSGPKAKSKSNKPKLLPISTPLQQLLKLQSAEELWQYVQQAKTYATSRMNKGDKRSASIALKRAQALEARWQEVLLELASSGEDTDEILEEEDDDDEEEEGEDQQEDQSPPEPATKEPVKVELKKETIAPVSVIPMAAPPTPTPTGVVFNTPNTHSGIRFEATDEDEEEDEFEAHRRRRSTISRSNSTPDKYSKYKVNKTPAAASSSSSTNSSTNNSTNVSSSLAILAEEETNEQGELSVKSNPAVVDDGRLGPEATMEQLVASTNKEHLKFYIQRMKTDTVAKARSGSKFAALEGMKNVKVLQQRLVDLEEEEGEEEEEKGKNEDKAEAESHKDGAEDLKSVVTTNDDGLNGQGTEKAEVVSEQQL